jgi:hypothetical protein
MRLRLLLVCFTEKTEHIVRNIRARLATKRERQDFVENKGLQIDRHGKMCPSSRCVTVTPHRPKTRSCEQQVHAMNAPPARVGSCNRQNHQRIRQSASTSTITEPYTKRLRRPILHLPPTRSSCTLTPSIGWQTSRSSPGLWHSPRIRS